jgi:hypothetical protein
MTLYGKDRNTDNAAPLTFPNELNRKNVAHKPKFQLPQTWQ